MGVVWRALKGGLPSPPSTLPRRCRRVFLTGGSFLLLQGFPAFPCLAGDLVPGMGGTWRASPLLEAGHQFLRGVRDGLLALTRVPGVSTVQSREGKARVIMRLLRIT